MNQIILAGLVAFFVSIFLTPVLIKRFSAEGLGQTVREDGPKSHLRKSGTPTMGGIAILAGIIAGFLASAILAWTTGRPGPGASGWLVLFLTLGLGTLGFADDYIKVARGRNLGLNAKAKLIGQCIIALIFGVLSMTLKDENGVTPASTHFSFVRDIAALDFFGRGAIVGTVLFLAFIYFVISAWSNAVNITDGLDGLAAGVTGIVLGAYVLITFWQFRNSCAQTDASYCYEVRDPLDLAVLAAAGLGACFGFLWWNAAPAKIFMGDTSSLALGGLIAGLSVTSRTELLMVIIGAIFVIEIASVALQITSFKMTKKRIFRMAPIHHHYENGGWAETTVVIRFWILASVFAMIGMVIFYADWLVSSAV